MKQICLKQKSVSLLHKNIISLYITYKPDKRSKDLNTEFTLGNWLYRAVKLTKNADPDKDEYSSYDIGFNSLTEFSW